MMCCSGRKKENNKNNYTLVESKLVTRKKEISEDLCYAIAETTALVSLSGGVITVGACTGTLPSLAPGIAAGVLGVGIASATAVKLYRRLDRVNKEIEKLS
jgi:hypothetical protein